MSQKIVTALLLLVGGLAIGAWMALILTVINMFGLNLGIIVLGTIVSLAYIMSKALEEL